MKGITSTQDAFCPRQLRSNCLRICGTRNSRGPLTSSRHRLAPGLRHATTAHTSEMSKEAWASVVLRFSFSLSSLVLRFSSPAPALILCLHLHRLALARKGQKRLPLRTTKVRTTNELAYRSPFAPNVPRPGIKQSGYWKFEVGKSIVRIYSPLFCPPTVKLFTDLC